MRFFAIIFLAISMATAGEIRIPGLSAASHTALSRACADAVDLSDRVDKLRKALVDEQEAIKKRWSVSKSAIAKIQDSAASASDPKERGRTEYAIRCFNSAVDAEKDPGVLMARLAGVYKQHPYLEKIRAHPCREYAAIEEAMARLPSVSVQSR